LAGKLPGYVTSAEHGTGWIGHLATKYHIQSWVQKNAPKLVTYAESLSKPVLTVGKGAISLLIELFTIFVLVLLLLLEAPKMRTWLLGQMRPERAATVTRIGSEVSRSQRSAPRDQRFDQTASSFPFGSEKWNRRPPGNVKVGLVIFPSARTILSMVGAKSAMRSTLRAGSSRDSAGGYRSSR